MQELLLFLLIWLLKIFAIQTELNKQNITASFSQVVQEVFKVEVCELHA